MRMPLKVVAFLVVLLPHARMTHDLWASLNQKMIEFLDSISLKKLVDEQLAKGVSITEQPIRRAISTVPVVKPIKITAPNSVFALGNAMFK